MTTAAIILAPLMAAVAAGDCAAAGLADPPKEEAAKDPVCMVVKCYYDLTVCTKMGGWAAWGVCRQKAGGDVARRKRAGAQIRKCNKDSSYKECLQKECPQYKDAKTVSKVPKPTPVHPPDLADPPYEEAKKDPVCMALRCYFDLTHMAKKMTAEASTGVCLQKAGQDEARRKLAASKISDCRKGSSFKECLKRECPQYARKVNGTISSKFEVPLTDGGSPGGGLTGAPRTSSAAAVGAVAGLSVVLTAVGLLMRKAFAPRHPGSRPCAGLTEIE